MASSDSSDLEATGTSAEHRSGEEAVLLPAGTTVGRYEILRLIGQGGMGAVYEALHRDLGKRVAIKTLQPHVAKNPAVRARFVREGQAASKIRHEHVVDVYDVGIEREMPYLVMEYLEGEDLSDVVRREGKLSTDRVAGIMVPVIAAVAAAHDLGIVHRDLKPENIFLSGPSASPKPKVLDFGISKLVDEGNAHALTGTSALLGTPFYMSPEQAQSAKNIDGRSDQFSIGVILYELSTGQRPFRGSTLYSLLQSIVETNYERPHVVDPSVSPDLEAIIVRAMSKEPADRFPNIRALGAALLDLADDRTRILYGGTFLGEASTLNISERSVPLARSSGPSAVQLSYPGTATTPTAQKSRSPLVAAGIGVGVLAVLGAVLVMRGQPHEDPSSSAVRSGNQGSTPAIATSPAPVVTPVAAAPTAEKPATVRRTVRSEPAGAEVWRDGKKVGVTPFDVELAADQSTVDVELRADGYTPTQGKISRSGPDEISVPLAKHASSKPPAAVVAAPPKPAMPKLAPR
jgi:eukaryotic-like serine/threonine-protein kinase